MTTAEKLTQIAENQQRVYDAGLAQGQSMGGYAEGQQAEYDRFWDLYQKNGTLRSSNGFFAGCGWNPNTLKPKYSIRPTSAAMMFYRCNTHSDNATIDLTKIFDDRGLTLDFSECTDFQQIFYGAKIETVGTIDCSKASGSNQVLNIFNTEYLRKVRGFIPPDIALPVAAFQTNLEQLIVKGAVTKSINLSRCSKLTDASIQSIFDNLTDLTGQTAQTITLHATVGGKLTQAQKDIASARNWTLAY